MIEDLTGGAVQPSGNHFEAAVSCFLGDLLPYITTPSESNVRSILPLDNPEICRSEEATETESTTSATSSSASGVTTTTPGSVVDEVITTITPESTVDDTTKEPTSSPTEMLPEAGAFVVPSVNAFTTMILDRPLRYRNMSVDSLTIVAPKIEKKEALEKTKSTKIEIKIGESNTAKLKDNVEDETTEYRKVPTPLAIESMKKEEPVEEAK